MGEGGGTNGITWTAMRFILCDVDTSKPIGAVLRRSETFYRVLGVCAANHLQLWDLLHNIHSLLPVALSSFTCCFLCRPWHFNRGPRVSFIKEIWKGNKKVSSSSGVCSPGPRKVFQVCRDCVHEDGSAACEASVTWSFVWEAGSDGASGRGVIFVSHILQNRWREITC